MMVIKRIKEWLESICSSCWCWISWWGTYKGAKLAYNTFKYGTKLKFTNITTKKSKPNFQANISLRQLHNRLGKAGWNQETFYKNGLQIRDFTKMEGK